MSRRAASDALVATRAAVDRAIADLPEDSMVLVACSGGPDSLALAGSTAWVAGRRGLRAGAVVVDHGLQPGSHEVARLASAACEDLGLAAEIARVDVGSAGGPEAAARAARYAALERAATEQDAATVLLGHTIDDQAETVLLRLTRGAGARSLAAMSARTGLWRRPFLALERRLVHAAAEELVAPYGRMPWIDPHNDDRDFARVRVRQLLASLDADLGAGVVRGLARSAEQLRDDADLLEALAATALAETVEVDGETACADCDRLAQLPAALRTRVIRLACLGLGSPPDALGHEHVRRVDALVTDWRGQGEIRLPGGVVAVRSYGRLCLHSTGRGRKPHGA